MIYHPIVRKELEKYLPNFDATRDPQIGEWVLVTPHRRKALIDPLIQISVENNIQPIYPFLDEGNIGKTSPIKGLLNESNQSISQIDPRKVFPTLEEVRRKFRRRRTHRISSNKESKEKKHEEEEEEEEEEDETVLYLNIRALLLTPCTPAVFGGSDFIEGLDKETGRVIFVNWRTGEVRTDTAALTPKPTPEWADELVEKAFKEWESWQRRDTMAAQAKEEDSDAPPLQKVRK